jgi:hypothetical protein
MLLQDHVHAPTITVPVNQRLGQIAERGLSKMFTTISVARFTNARISLLVSSNCCSSRRVLGRQGCTPRILNLTFRGHGQD